MAAEIDKPKNAESPPEATAEAEQRRRMHEGVARWLPEAEPLDAGATRADERWMAEALQLAEATIGLAAPNPVVGCVLVKDGVVVGRGAHLYDRLDHAEVVALGKAEKLARGATAYVTLEPCAHVGRTGPCADALIEAGVQRVIVATVDPNPAVSGRGVARLRAAGIEVVVGVLAERARASNDGFARHIRWQRPFVTLKAGCSLDGRIAPARPASAKHQPGATIYLTGAHSLLAVQRMRHASDAVLTGIGTALADNPLLTDRSGLPRRRPLLRVILDSHLRLPLDSRLVESANGDLLVYTLSAEGSRADALRQAGVEVEAVAPTFQPAEPQPDEPEPKPPGAEGDGRLDLAAVFASLGERHGVASLLVEAGSHLNRVLLGEDRVDKLCLFYAPLFLGEAGLPLVAGRASVHPELLRASVRLSGDDFYMEAYLRDPWR